MAGGNRSPLPPDPPRLDAVSLEHARALWRNAERRGSCLLHRSRYYRRKWAYSIPARKLAYAIHHGDPGPRAKLFTACGQERCINPDHITTRRLGLHPTGERHHLARINYRTAREMRRRREAGETYQDIADRYGVSLGCAWKAITYRTWVRRRAPEVNREA